MAVIFVVGGLVILGLNFRDIPDGLAFIVHSAFTPTAATGGFAGAAVWAGIRYGVARGVFSNEAGLGSAAIAHAAAKSHDAVQQGMVAMLGTFIDTIVVCTITALVIVTVHVPVEMADGSTQMMAAWASGKTGAELSSLAFSAGLPGELGKWIVTFGLMLFAFTTILGWSYYGERAAEYLFGVKVILPYRLLWVVFVFVGSILKLGLVWTVTDILNALMAFPNLVALLLLSGVVFRLTRESSTARTGKI
jgi:alanine or glycine:cation symporter, AGCS family